MNPEPCTSTLNPNPDTRQSNPGEGSPPVQTESGPVMDSRPFAESSVLGLEFGVTLRSVVEGEAFRASIFSGKHHELKVGVKRFRATLD